MSRPAVSNASTILEALRTRSGAGEAFGARRSITYRKAAAPIRSAAAETAIDGGSRAACFHAGASMPGARYTAAARISNASEARPSYHHDERSRIETDNTTAIHPKTPSGYSQ